MKKTRFTNDQILLFLQQAREGIPVKELCHLGGFSHATFYRWRRRWSGLDRSDVNRLRELEAENTVLKRLLADVDLAMLAVAFLA